MTPAQEKDFISDIAALLGEMVIRCHLKGIVVSNEGLKKCLISFDLSADPYWNLVSQHALSILEDNWSDDENIVDFTGARR